MTNRRVLDDRCGQIVPGQRNQVHEQPSILTNQISIGIDILNK